MRYVVAIVGAVLIFAGTFLVVGILYSLAVARAAGSHVQIGPLWTNNVAGLLLGTLAASSSFRASLREAAKGRKTGAGKLDAH